MCYIGVFLIKWKCPSGTDESGVMSFASIVYFEDTGREQHEYMGIAIAPATVAQWIRHRPPMPVGYNM